MNLERCSTECVLLSTFLCSYLLLQTSFTQFSPRGGLSDEVSHQNSELSTPLSKPPLLENLLPRSRLDGRERSVPSHHDRPFVYASSAFSLVNKSGKEELPILFLYAQGTSIFDRSTKKILTLNITSCFVREEKYSLLYRTNGLFACFLTRELRFGEPLSLVLSPTIFNEEADEEHISHMRGYMQGMRKMEDGFYIIPTDAFWEGQIDPPIQRGEGRYEVCLMTQEKLFADYLPEWIEYHRKLGVDHVYIYDNKAPDNISRMLEHRSDVELVYWPWHRSQIQAQNHFILNGRRRCKWAILIDVDEYVMINSLQGSDDENALKLYLRALQEDDNYSQVKLSTTTLGSSGHKLRPRIPVAEAYWHYADQQDNRTKPIVYLPHAIPDSHVHFVKLGKTYHTLSRSREYRTRTGIEMELVHMKFRAWSDYLTKAHGGRNSMAVSSWDFSSNWTISSGSPMQRHLQDINSDSFIKFRTIWRRVISRCTDEGKLVRFHQKERRF